MPESPEVQALVEELDARTSGRAVTRIDVLEFRTVKTRTSPPESLVGETVEGVRRFGKHVDFAIGGRHLGVALGRHGWARWSTPATATGDPAAPPALVTIGFDSGEALDLTDAGSWVSLGLSVVTSPADVPAVAKLGPDPADPAFSMAEFDAAVIGRRKQLKAVLQEQESLAGIGNAYSDEILHTAKLSPVVHAATLSAEERELLYTATIDTIRRAIAARRGTPIGDLKAAKVASMSVHGRAGEPCPVCGDTVRDFRFGGTTAQYCATCQTSGLVL